VVNKHHTPFSKELQSSPPDLELSDMQQSIATTQVLEMHFQNKINSMCAHTRHILLTLRFHETGISLHKEIQLFFNNKKLNKTQKKCFYSPDQTLMKCNFSVTEKNVLFFFPQLIRHIKTKECHYRVI